MNHTRVIIFLVLSAAFAAVHLLALKASLYWYFWWFDVVMHFWGGILIGLGVYTLCTLSRFRCRVTLKMILIALVIATGTWEIFEWWADLWQPTAYYFDTVQDIALGFGGGLLAHVVLKTDTIS